MAEVFGVTLPNISLKIFVLLHFILLTFSGWGILNYALMNYFVVALGIWTLVNKEDSTLALFYVAFLGVSVVSDIALLAFWHYAMRSGNGKFSVFVSVVLLLVKAANTVYAWGEHRRRSGEGNVSGYTNFGESDVSPTYLPDHISPPIPGVDM